MLHDLENLIGKTKCLTPQVVTDDQDGASIDLLEYRQATFYAMIGVSGDTLSGSVKIELELEDSDDDSSFSDCADADLSNAVAGTNDGCWGLIDDPAEDDAVFSVTYKGSARYVRPVVNVTGTHSNGTPIAIIGFAVGANNLPPGRF
jgi:hypothetical protein